MVRVTVPIAVAETMLQTTYHRFRHTKTGTTVLRTHNYSVPASLSAHLDLVAPTKKFPGVTYTPKKAHDSLKHDNTPASLRKLYKVGAAKGNATANRQSCTAFLGQYYKETVSGLQVQPVYTVY
jgi:tripeptidyl-peptidase-1